MQENNNIEVYRKTLQINLRHNGGLSMSNNNNKSNNKPKNKNFNHKGNGKFNYDKDNNGKNYKAKNETDKIVSVRVNQDSLRNKDILEQEYNCNKEEEDKLAKAKEADQKADQKAEMEKINDVEMSKKELDVNEEKIEQIKPNQKKDLDNSAKEEIKETQNPTSKPGDAAEKEDDTLNNEVKPVKGSTKEKEKKEKRPSRIDLKDKSEQFKKIIDIAIAYEKVEEEKKKLKEKNKTLTDLNKELQEDKESLKGNLAAIELLCKKKQEEIDGLKSEVAQRNEVIGIVKADKTESAQEFKNALAASLRSFYVDFEELKSMDMSEDVGYAIVETLDNVFKALDKNGIHIQK